MRIREFVLPAVMFAAGATTWALGAGSSRSAPFVASTSTGPGSMPWGTTSTAPWPGPGTVVSGPKPAAGKTIAPKFTLESKLGGEWIAFSRFLNHGQTMLCALGENTLVIWDLKPGAQPTPFTGFTASFDPFTLDLSANGKSVVVGSPMGSLFVANVTDKKMVHSIPTQMGWIAKGVLSADGSRVANTIGSGNSAKLRIIDTGTGEVKFEAPGQEGGSSSNDPWLMSSPKGDMFVYQGKKDVELFSFDGKKLATWPRGSIRKGIPDLRSVDFTRFNPDGKSIAIVDEDHVIISDSSGKELKRLKLGMADAYYDAPTFDAQGNRLLLQRRYHAENGSIHRAVEMYDMATGNRLWQMNTWYGNGAAPEFEISPDGKFVLVAKENPGGIIPGVMNPSGYREDGQGDFFVVDAVTGKEVTAQAVGSLEAFFSGDSKRVYYRTQTDVFQLDVASKKATLVAHSNESDHLVINADAGMVMLVGKKDVPATSGPATAPWWATSAPGSMPAQEGRQKVVQVWDDPAAK